MHHHPRPRDPHAPVPERDFLQAYELVYELVWESGDDRRRRLQILERLDTAFPFHPAMPRRILLRLGALAEIWRHPLMQAWRAMPTAGGLGDIALHVAATHPLSEQGWFIPQSFFAEMLRRMDDAGRA
ncbi:MAG: hypothetical protein KF889_21125 [Alphaproteobacteria bacterium]|nr:hypothetical protein [Alphaproteobacteria bacterium]MCW5743144.1 hypothetical protein [Alphaproteobacteria bacterium]